MRKPRGKLPDQSGAEDSSRFAESQPGKSDAAHGDLRNDAKDGFLGRNVRGYDHRFVNRPADDRRMRAK